VPRSVCANESAGAEVRTVTRPPVTAGHAVEGGKGV